MTWPLMTFLAIWSCGFAALAFMTAAVPSTVKASNGDFLVLAAITGAVAAITTLTLVGAVSLIS